MHSVRVAKILRNKNTIMFKLNYDMNIYIYIYIIYEYTTHIYAFILTINYSYICRLTVLLNFFLYVWFESITATLVTKEGNY